MEIKNSNVLITGGAGAIGGNLARAVLSMGARRVVILDNLSSGFIANVPDGAVFVKGSILDENVLDVAFYDTIDIVFHLAAHFANQNSVEHPEEDLETNAVGTVKLLKRARQAKVKRFLYASSSCIYGAKAGPIPETPAPGVLETPYAASKYAGEEYTRLFHELYQFPTTSVRYFNSFGPGEMPGPYRNVIPNFIAKALKGEPLVITGTGEETRDFCFVESTVSGTIAAATLPAAIGGVYNIGSGIETTIRTLAETINRLTGNTQPIQYVPRRSWDQISRRCADISRARRDLNFVPVIDFEPQLARTIEWHKKQQHS